MANCGCGKAHFFAPKCKICGAKFVILVGSDHMCLECCDMPMHVVCPSCGGKNRLVTDHRRRTATCTRCDAAFDFTKHLKLVPKNTITK